MNWTHLLLQAAEGAAEVAENAAEVAEVSAEASAVSLIANIGMMVLIFVVFYFLLIRPQRKKDKAAKEMLKNLKVGDRVCTIGGIYGSITQIKDETLTLSVGQDNVKLVFARWAIRNVEEISIANDAESLI